MSRAPVRGAQQPDAAADGAPGVTRRSVRRKNLASPELRAQWMAPIIVSPHDPATIYAGYQFVLRSTNAATAGRRSART